MSESSNSTRCIVIELRWSRRGALSIVTVLVIAVALLSFTLALARVGLSAPAVSPALTASTMVSYQGRITVNGTPFNGTGQFKFAVVNAEGTAAYWSNDGTGLTTVPFTPTNAVALTVSSGLFNVLLGDTSLPNMTQPLKPDAFAAPDRVLRVWFNDGVNGFQRLASDVRVASAPYALNAEFARTSPNLQRIALLKWYTAISTTHVFSVGSFPSEAAFDGSNIWVSNYGGGVGNTVSVLRANDGSLVATYSTGTGPQGIAFDGVNMWVANSRDNSNTVSVLRASDGFHIMTPTVGHNPLGIAFDGANMWVTNYFSNTVSVLRASDGFHVMTPTVGPGPYGMAFDGVNMWVANFGPNGTGNTVSVLRASDGFHVMTVTVGPALRHIAFDGVNMWVTNEGSNNVSVIRASDGFHVMTPTVGIGPIGIAFDGANMWVANGGFLSGNTVSVLRASDGVLIKTVIVGNSPSGVAFDGANMWITNYNDSTISKR